MSAVNISKLIAILKLPSERRSSSDINELLSFLKKNEGLIGSSSFTAEHETALRQICRIACHRRIRADELLFCKGDYSDSWFILLSGLVIIDNTLYLPNNCFGIRPNSSHFRQADCLAVEDSDLISIEYPKTDNLQTNQQAVSYRRSGSIPANPTGRSEESSTPYENAAFIQATSNNVNNNADSASSNGSVQGTKSASLSSTRSSTRATKQPSLSTPGHEIVMDDEDDDLDYDLEADDSSSQPDSISDAFLRCMFKEPAERSREDQLVLFDYIHKLPAVSSFTHATVRALCAVMQAAVITEAGQTVLGHGEVLDTWAIILNGVVEVTEPDGTIRELTLGDAFGVKPAGLEKQTHKGVMRTMTEDCQFAYVAQADFVAIMAKEGENNVTEKGEGGRILLVYEDVSETPATPDTAGKPCSSGLKLVTRGTQEKLIDHLMADHGATSADPTYMEDFLLTYRTFLDSPQLIVKKLLTWYRNESLRARAKRCVLLWLHSHFVDFEDNYAMLRFLEEMDDLVAEVGTPSERRLFHLACSTKAKPRTVELELSVAKAIAVHHPRAAGQGGGLTVFVPFTLVSGRDRHGVFISQVDRTFRGLAYAAEPETDSGYGDVSSLCSASSVGGGRRPVLRCADQLLALNGKSVEGLLPESIIGLIMNYVGANATAPAQTAESPAINHANSNVACINLTCKIRLTVVYNPLQFHQQVTSAYQQQYHYPRKSSCIEASQQQHQQHPGAELRKPSLPSSMSIPHALTDNSSQGEMPGAKLDVVTAMTPSKCRSAHQSPNRKMKGTPEMSSVGAKSKPAFNQPGPGQNLLGTPNSSSGVSGSNRSLFSNSSSLSSSQPDIPNGFSKSLQLHHLPPLTTRALRHSSTGDIFGSSEPSQVIRVWRSADCGHDQSSKLVLIRPSTTVVEACRLAAEEFGLQEEEHVTLSLYQVTVDNGPLVKQSRLADQLFNLADRATLNARYYLRVNRSAEPLITDEIAKNIITDSEVSLLNLNLEQLAIHMTLENYEQFRAIEPTEYVDSVFELSAAAEETSSAECKPEDSPRLSDCSGFATGHANLARYTDLINRETGWAPSELCAEPSINKRVELLKRFIKLVKLFQTLRNYNSMFCLLLGLHQASVERLRQTWERLPNKHAKLFQNLSTVLDPSRNFAQYRSVLNGGCVKGNACKEASSNEAALQASAMQRAPVLPYLPIVLKDLTFIHLGNRSKVDDNLINFVKLRMLAKEIRNVCRYCNVDYDSRMAWSFLKPSSNSGTSSGLSVDWRKRKSGARAVKEMLSVAKSSMQSGSVKEGNGPSLGEAMNLSFDFAQNVSLDEPAPSSRSLLPGLTTLKRAGSSGPALTALEDSGSASSGRRRSTLSGPSANPKKLYDSFMTSLKIRSYLAGLRFVSDSCELSRMSQTVEPPPGQKVKPAKPSVDAATKSADQVKPPVDTPNSPPSSAQSSPEKRVDDQSCYESSQLHASASPNVLQFSLVTGDQRQKSLPRVDPSMEDYRTHRSILGKQSAEDARRQFTQSLQKRRPLLNDSLHPYALKSSVNVPGHHLRAMSRGLSLPASTAAAHRMVPFYPMSGLIPTQPKLSSGACPRHAAAHHKHQHHHHHHHRHPNPQHPQQQQHLHHQQKHQQQQHQPQQHPQHFQLRQGNPQFVQCKMDQMRRLALEDPSNANMRFQMSQRSTSIPNQRSTTDHVRALAAIERKTALHPGEPKRPPVPSHQSPASQMRPARPPPYELALHLRQSVKGELIKHEKLHQEPPATGDGLPAAGSSNVPQPVMDNRISKPLPPPRTVTSAMQAPSVPSHQNLAAINLQKRSGSAQRGNLLGPHLSATPTEPVLLRAASYYRANGVLYPIYELITSSPPNGSHRS